MGMWAFEPWDNDAAADWYGDFMDTTGFRAAWLKGISADSQTAPDIVRAAGALFVMLGRVYVWPIKSFDEDLEKTIAALESLNTCEEYKEVPELMQRISIEVEELKFRRKPAKTGGNLDATPLARPWWRFWK